MKIILNSAIYTFDADRPRADALLIDGGRIRLVGEKDEILARRTSQDAVLDLGNRVILPGLVDAHLHLEQYALGLQKVDCETETKTECLRRVAARARSLEPGSWVLGHGWNQNNWVDGYGSAVELDEVAPGHPVYLTAKSLHAGWANSQALRLAGIGRDTPNPADGRIGRDPKGNLTGILFEGAVSLVEQAIPEPTIDALARAIEAAQPTLWGMGLVGVHDFDRWRCFSALQLLHQQERLHLRVLKSIPVDDLPSAAELGLRSGFGDDTLRIGGVKAFADGALGPRTAAMLAPYQGEPDNRGMSFMNAEELFELGRNAVEAGLPLAVHAIGDRANHEVLNGFERLREYEKQHDAGGPPFRHRIEHVQLIHPNDAPRLARLGVTASMQPIHATSDMLMADRYWGERAAYAYAFRTQLEHGATLAFGSDAPVESPNPFWGLHAAVTRRRLDGSPGEGGWFPEQRLSVQQALEAYLLGPAFAAGMENRSGKLAPGFLADLIVLDRDPFEIPADELHSLRPSATMVGGEWVLREF